MNKLTQNLFLLRVISVKNQGKQVTNTLALTVILFKVFGYHLTNNISLFG